MKIKLDENLPISLTDILTESNHDVDSVFAENLKGKSDKTVWQKAQDEGRFFITQDLDFSDLRSFQPGNHNGILIVRLSNPSRRKIINRLSTIFKFENVEKWKKCFVVVTDSKIRVRKPSS
ncbi:MAG: hypothetical protein D6732_05775 [Methanobacteriota archaeon]|nr:MAG: hypothetical protein D6732_05775 [Euryarchaeota archaeon]